MSGLDKDRKRNQTIAFRMTPEERQELRLVLKLQVNQRGFILLNLFYIRK